MAEGLIKRAPASEAFDPNEVLSEKFAFDPNEVLAPSTTPQGELPAGTRAGLGFMSGEAERRRYILKKHPGATFSKWKDEDVVLLPGEKSPRYIDDPSLTMTDIADFAGDIPGVIGGVAGGVGGGGLLSVAGAGAGAMAGEAARKAIGRKFMLDEDVIQPGQVGSDLKDIAISGAAGAGGQAVSNAVVGQLARRSAQRAAENIGKNTGKKVIAQGVEGMPQGGLQGPAAGQAGASQADDAARRFNVNLEGEGVIRGELSQAPNAIDDAVNATQPPPKSMKEMVERYETDLARGAVPELPSANRLREIEQILPDLETRPTGIHYAMLKDKQSFDVLRVKLRELPGKERQALDAYDQRMKAEITQKIDQMIGPGAQGKTDAGIQLMNDVSRMHKAQRAKTGPLFEELQSVPIDSKNHVGSLSVRLAEEVPGFGDAIAVNQETGKLMLKPFRPDMGISRKAYSEMNTVVRSLNEGELSFKQMQRIREYLRKQIDPSKPGETRDLEGIRKAMLSHMEDLVQAQNPDLNVRETFKAWAKNERMLESFEEMLGGKMEALDSLFKANPDRVLNNLFANPNTVEVTRSLLGPERFKALSGDYLNMLKEASFDSAKNQVSMARFASFLKQKRGVIEAAYGKEAYRRLSALADLGKVIPDMPPVNPSGTGKTSMVGKVIRGAQKITGSISGSLTGVGDIQAAANALDERATAKDAVKHFNDLLARLPGEDPKTLAEKLLPYAKSKTSRALLQAMAQSGGPKLLGPATEGLVGKPQIRGPEGR